MPKTTIDISEDILLEAKAHAARERTTLRQLVESGLRATLGRSATPDRFRLRDASVGGRGLQPEFASGAWERVRDAIYDDPRA